jgi:serine/threonine protein phosphatase 1
MSLPIHKLPSNHLGKDYIVGDLHGCFSLLDRLMNDVGFNKNHDRLFSVGDLIDRGPESLRCLQLLAEPWFYAVKGNHEDMFLELFMQYLLTNKLPSPNVFNNSSIMDNGGEWIIDYINQAQQAMSVEFDNALELVAKMPLIYIVGEGVHRFHVIHADLTKPKAYSIDNLVYLDSDIDQFFINETISCDVEDRLYWSRILMKNAASDLYYPSIQKGLSTTFCGHTVAKEIRQVLSHVCLDTGAYISIDPDYGLVLYDVMESHYFWTSSQQTKVTRNKVTRKK